jgi:TRAP-type C4-dicarboxylate transport system permease small subunit
MSIEVAQVERVRACEPGARYWAWFDRADYWLLQAERVGMGLAGLCLTCVFLMLIAGVFGRPWTGLLFSISLEGGSMSMWPISYMGAAFIWRVYGHPQFDLFLRVTRGRKHHVLQLVNNLCALVIGIYLAWYAWESYQFQFKSNSATQNLRYVYWPVYWTAFVGLGLLAIELAFSLLRHVREIIHPTMSEESIYGVYDDGGAV